MSINKLQNSIVGISLITAACLIGDSMLYIVLPLHFTEAGLDNLWEVGAILSVNRFIRLPLNPLVGWLYRKIALRTGIMLAIILAVLTTIAYSFIQGLYAWLFVRCVWGLAWTFLRLGAYFTILDLSTEQNRGYLMGKYNGLYRLGSLFGMLFGGFIADFYGLSNTALLFGIITILAIPLSLLTLPVPVNRFSVDEANPQQKNLLLDSSIYNNSQVIWVLFMGMGVAMIFQGMFAATLSYLVELHNSANISFLLWNVGAASLAGILQAVRWGWEPWLAPWIGGKTDGRTGRYPLFIISLIVSCLLFLLISRPMSIYLWLSLVLGIQVTATALTTIVDALAADIAIKTAQHSVMTWYSLFIDLGAALGPVLAYLLDQYIAVYSACWGVAVLLIVMATTTYWQHRLGNA